MPAMDPVIVSEVMPVGTAICKEVEEVLAAMVALDGTTPGELEARETVTFCVGRGGPEGDDARDRVTVASPPAGAGLGEIVTALSAWRIHGMLPACAGGFGGVAHGTLTKSKNSFMGGWAASRAVKLGRLKRVSMSLRIAV